VGQVPVDMEFEHRQASESIRLFLELTRKASSVLGAGALAAEDGRFDAHERKELDDLLAELMQAATELRASLRGA
jgi:tellurite resistance protein